MNFQGQEARVKVRPVPANKIEKNSFSRKELPMELAKLREQPHLSVSSITDYVDCGLLFKFSRIDKLEPEFKADSLLFGSTVHQTLAQFYTELKTGRKMGANQLQEIFESYWRRSAFEREDIRYKPGKNYETLLSEGKELLAIFHQKLPENVGTIISIEEPFIFWLDGLPIPIIGIYDLVVSENEILTIIDHKTSSRKFSDADVNKNFQLTVYHMAARANGFSGNEILLRFDCLIKSSVKKFETYYSTRSELDEVKAVKKILAVYDGIQKGVFIPNDTSWKCAGCAYKQACENWFCGNEP
jgi:putative RecB family exonuclease